VRFFLAKRLHVEMHGGHIKHAFWASHSVIKPIANEREGNRFGPPQTGRVEVTRTSRYHKRLNNSVAIFLLLAETASA
jgi:hypothetical protein